MTMPCRNLVLIPTEQYDLAVYSVSFHEYESWKEGNDGVTAFTLLRSVSQVYNTGLPTKDEKILGVGARWLSKDAKMHGEYEFSYAFELLPQNTDETAVLQRALEYQFPLYLCGITPYGKRTLSDYKGLELKGAVWSALDRKGDRIIARYYNPKETSANIVLTCNGREYSAVLGAKKIGETDITEFL